MRKLPTRLCVSIVALFALCRIGAAGAQARQDTWTGVERIVAVGDVHGDYDQFAKVLRAAEVVDANLNWTAGKCHLVQLGDVLDRAPDSRKVMDLLMKLEPQAARAGGAVHALIGNHEAMVLLDDWRYVHPGEIEAFGGADGFRKAMSAQGQYGRWIRTHNTAIRINDLLFVHAGIARAWARMSLTEINEAVRRELNKGDAEGIAMSVSGPLWTRTLALGDDEAVAEQLDAVLRSCGARRMVVAHTVSTKGILARAGGRLIRIDVGMCKYYGGPAACLLVEKGTFYEVRHPGTRRKLALETPVTRPAATRKPASAPAPTAIQGTR